MNGIIGAVCGDVIGSVYEFNPIKTKNFTLFSKNSKFTDDTVMTIAIANWLLKDKTSIDVLIDELKYWGLKYPDAGYGGMFRQWLAQESPKDYGSWANGSAMRVSPCAWAGKDLEEVQKLARLSSCVTHSHPDAVEGALAVADAVYLARNDYGKDEIKSHLESNYSYDLNRSIDEIRPDYKFDVSCKGSVGEAIICFLEAKDFEDAIRNAVSLGGDADTQAAICGSIASAYFEVPEDIGDKTISYLDENIMSVLNKFSDSF